MTSGIHQNPAMLGHGLPATESRAEFDSLRLRNIEVVDHQIEVDLLRYGARRPRARLVVFDANRGDLPAGRAYDREFLIAVRNFTTKQISPEFCKVLRIVTVEGDRSQASYGHGVEAT